MKELFKLTDEVRDIRVGMQMEGVVQCLVIDAKTGEIVKEYKPQKNLILNQGMDEIATQNICDEFLYSVIGTATTPTQDSGGVTTAAQSTTTVTLVGGAFLFTNTATDGGKMIKFLSGEEARIVTITDTTHAVVADSKTVAATTFTVYRTNQTGLTTETKRTNNYLTGAGNTETTINGGAATISHKRTYDHTVEGGSITYNELGFSRVAGAGANCFSRILLGSGVALSVGQQLRVIYTLTLTFSPATSQSVGVSPITGMSGATGVQQCQYPNMTGIRSTTGATDLLPPDGVGGQSSTSSGGFEPSRTGFPFVLSTTLTTFNTFGSQGPARSGASSSANVSLSTYSALSFTITKTGVFATGQGNGTVWRSLIMGGDNGGGAGSNQGFVYIFDTNQTKDNTHTLTINLILTWGRVLA